MKICMSFCRTQLVLCRSALLPLVLTLSGCATIGGGDGKLREQSAEQAKRIERLEKQLRKTQAALEESKERNLILETKHSRKTNPDKFSNSSAAAVTEASKVPIPFHPSAGKEFAAQVEEPPQQNSAAAVTIPSGEELLYSKALESYRKNDVAAMQKSVEILLKTYRDSMFADNALYLASMLSIEKNQNDRAGQYLDRLLTEYPHGNKAVAGLFAKGMLEKRLGRTQSAKASLRKVLKLYPGSPESFRAKIELKILETTSDQPTRRAK